MVHRMTEENYMELVKSGNENGHAVRVQPNVNGDLFVTDIARDLMDDLGLAYNPTTRDFDELDQDTINKRRRIDLPDGMKGFFEIPIEQFKIDGKAPTLTIYADWETSARFGEYLENPIVTVKTDSIDDNNWHEILNIFDAELADDYSSKKSKCAEPQAFKLKKAQEIDDQSQGGVI